VRHSADISKRRYDGLKPIGSITFVLPPTVDRGIEVGRIEVGRIEPNVTNLPDRQRE
jgi:hypothetical protein